MTRLIWMCFLILLPLRPSWAVSQADGSDSARPAPQALAKACAAQYSAQDFVHAATTCLESANNGDNKSAVLYAKIIGKGLGGVKADEKEAGEYLRKAAEDGFAEAQREYGRYWEAEQYDEKALEYYKLADKQGDPEAHELLNKLQKRLNSPVLDKKDISLARESLQAGVHTQETGAAELKAQNDKGVALCNAGNYAEGVSWFRKAADQGYAPAQLNLGKMYKSGSGISQDYAQAAGWIRKAADQGLAEAQILLGLLYDEGHGVAQDHTQATDWFRKAAEQGNAEAQDTLGVSYLEGIGVAKDYAQAAFWLRKAADQGRPQAQLFLGIMYELGRGIAQDYVQAAFWLKKAADQGNAWAQREMGILNEAGNGVPLDRQAAMSWYKAAIAQGDSIAKERLQKLETQKPEAQKLETAKDGLLACQGVGSERTCAYKDILKFTVPVGAEPSRTGEQAVIKMGESTLIITLWKHDIPPRSFMGMYWEMLRKSFADFKFKADFEGTQEQERMIDGIPVTIIFYTLTDRDGKTWDGAVHIRQLSGQALLVTKTSPGDESASALSAVMMNGIVYSDAFRQRLLTEAPEGQMRRYREDPKAYYEVNRIVGLRFKGSYRWKPITFKDDKDDIPGITIGTQLTVLSWPDSMNMKAIRDRLYQAIANESSGICCEVQQYTKPELNGVGALQLNLITSRGQRYTIIVTATNHSIMFPLGWDEIDKAIWATIDTFSFISNGIEFGM